MPKGKGTYGKQVGRPPKPKGKAAKPKRKMIVKNGTKKPMKKGGK
tara:strand:+ start:392 stop:526 length:135 start_codon:yes stop_codon:yes gene_type:complete